MPSVQIVEYEKAYVSLTEADVTVLLQHGDVFDVRPTSVAGQYQVTASRIGVVRLEGRSLIVRPRFGIQNALFLISYAISPDAWRAVKDDAFSEDLTLVEAVAHIFALQVGRALRKGVLQGYWTVEDVSPVVRGRIRVMDQVRRHQGRVPPIEITCDDFGEDVVENRLLKTATARLRRLALRSTNTRIALGGIEAMLGNVSEVNVEARGVPAVTYTRLNAHYRIAVELARLILRAASLEFGDGLRPGAAFLVDMANVFEEFLYQAGKDLVGPTVRFRHGDGGGALYLDHEAKVRLKPDLAVWSGESCLWVADAKYKTAVKGAREHDLYQMLAYVTATGLSEGTLIYADQGRASHETVNGGKRLRVESVDLSRSPAEILRQVHALMDEVPIRARVATRTA